MEIISFIADLCVLIGIFLCIRFSLHLLYLDWIHIFRPGCNLFNIYHDPTQKSYAIVTGASDGIGLAYCKQLYAAGFSIIMVARNITKLQQKRTEILGTVSPKISHVKPEILTVVLDFNQPYSKEQFSDFLNEIQNKDIAILVNNVGASNTYPYENIELDKISEMLRVNISSFVFTTRIVIPHMLNRQNYRKSAIISISSGVSQNPWPYKAIYGSTKTFMNRLMDSLKFEYASSNIDFLTCITGEVTTALNPRKSIGSCYPEQCAKEQLKALGYDSQTYGPFKHYLVILISRIKAVRWMVAKSMNKNCELRPKSLIK